MARDWAGEIAAVKAAFGLGSRGPFPGQGANAHAPWWGICEETPQLWASWLADYWRRKTGNPLPERPPFRLQDGAGVELAIESARLTYGFRWYFRCPWCGRRTEVLYQGRRGLACRRCNRLGYRSQARRPTVPAGLLDLAWGRAFGRYWGDERMLAELARDLTQDLAAGLERLLGQLRVVADSTEVQDGGDTA